MLAQYPLAEAHSAFSLFRFAANEKELLASPFPPQRRGTYAPGVPVGAHRVDGVVHNAGRNEMEPRALTCEVKGSRKAARAGRVRIRTSAGAGSCETFPSR